MRNYLISVADVKGYDYENDILFKGHTLLSPSLALSISNIETHSRHYHCLCSEELKGTIHDIKCKQSVPSLNKYLNNISSIIRLKMIVTLYSPDASIGKVGEVIINIPKTLITGNDEYCIGLDYRVLFSINNTGDITYDITWCDKVESTIVDNSNIMFVAPIHCENCGAIINGNGECKYCGTVYTRQKVG